MSNKIPRLGDETLTRELIKEAIASEYGRLRTEYWKSIRNKNCIELDALEKAYTISSVEPEAVMVFQRDMLAEIYADENSSVSHQAEVDERQRRHLEQTNQKVARYKNSLEREGWFRRLAKKISQNRQLSSGISKNMVAGILQTYLAEGMSMREIVYPLPGVSASAMLADVRQASEKYPDLLEALILQEANYQAAYHTSAPGYLCLAFMSTLFYGIGTQNPQYEKCGAELLEKATGFIPLPLTALSSDPEIDFVGKRVAVDAGLTVRQTGSVPEDSVEDTMVEDTRQRGARKPEGAAEEEPRDALLNVLETTIRRRMLGEGEEEKDLLAGWSMPLKTIAEAFEFGSSAERRASRTYFSGLSKTEEGAGKQSADAVAFVLSTMSLSKREKALSMVHYVQNHFEDLMDWYGRCLTGTFISPKAFSLTCAVFYTATDRFFSPEEKLQDVELPAPDSLNFDLLKRMEHTPSLDDLNPLEKFFLLLNVCHEQSNALFTHNGDKMRQIDRPLAAQWTMDLLYANRETGDVDPIPLAVMSALAYTNDHLLPPEHRYQAVVDAPEIQSFHEDVMKNMTALEAKMYMSLIKALWVCGSAGTQKSVKAVCKALAKKVLHTSPNKLGPYTRQLYGRIKSSFEELKWAGVHEAAVLMFFHLMEDKACSLGGTPYLYLHMDDVMNEPTVVNSDPYLAKLADMTERLLGTDYVGTAYLWNLSDTDPEITQALLSLEEANAQLDPDVSIEGALQAWCKYLLASNVVLNRRIAANKEMMPDQQEKAESGKAYEEDEEKQQMANEMSQMRIEHALQLSSIQQNAEARLEQEKKTSQEQIQQICRETKALERELEALRTANRELEERCQTLEMYRDAVEADETDQTESEEDSVETDASSDNPWQGIDNYFASHNVVLLGGHERLIRDLSLRYPKAKICYSLSDDVHLLDHADRVFIFYKFLGHALYDRVMPIIRGNDIPVTYISARNPKVALTSMQEKVLGPVTASSYPMA